MTDQPMPQVPPKDEPSSAGSVTRGDILGLLLVAAIYVATWFSAVDRSGFVEDDWCWIEDARSILREPTHAGTLHISGFFRPMVHYSFALNYALAGLQPDAYFAFNMIINLTAACVLWRLLRLMSLGSLPALCGTAFFLFHRAQAETLGWISGRTASMATLFVLAALMAWLQFRRSDSPSARRAWCMLSLASMAAALLTKEEAVVVLPLLVLAEAMLCARRHRWTALLPHLLLWLGWGMLQYRVQSQNVLVEEGVYGFGPQVLVTWLTRLPGLFMPQRLETVTGACITAAAVLAVMLSALRSATSRQKSVAWFGIATALLALAPTSLFQGSAAWAGRYLHMATTGAAIIVAAAMAALLHRAAAAPNETIEAPAAAAVRRPTQPQAWLLGIFLTLLVGSIAMQRHRMVGTLSEWNQRAAASAKLYGRLADSPGVAAIRDRCPAEVIIVTPPIDNAHHLQSLMRIVTGLDQLKVRGMSALSPGEASSGSVLVWDETSTTLRIMSTR